jgi:hypothetical protein
VDQVDDDDDASSHDRRPEGDGERVRERSVALESISSVRFDRNTQDSLKGSNGYFINFVLWFLVPLNPKTLVH